jgi:3-deoxy-D-manno-octulosonic-acid transferase
VNAAWVAYRMIAPALGAVAPAAWVFASPAERRFWSERMGAVEPLDACDAWVHAASLGEATAVGPLARELLALQPGARLRLTATTRSGRARLGALGAPVSLAPIDSPQAVERFFARARPRRLFIVETELWPHWLLRAAAAGVPVAIVSARLSERSVRRYGALGGTLRGLVGGLSAVLCQSDEDARRWLALGSRRERTEVVGNLKNDALPHPAASRGQARDALGLDPGRPLLVLGSVRPGEARLLARAWLRLPDALRASWQVTALPRHPRASADLRAEAKAARVCLIDAGAPLEGAWRWDDRLGVLNAYYAAAEVAFVGGSLLPYGGHNPLEPAACGAAVIVGSHHHAQREGVLALERRGGVQVASTEDELLRAMAELLGDDAARARQSGIAREVVDGLRGGARRAVTRLAEWDLWPPR